MQVVSTATFLVAKIVCTYIPRRDDGFDVCFGPAFSSARLGVRGKPGKGMRVGEMSLYRTWHSMRTIPSCMCTCVRVCVPTPIPDIGQLSPRITFCPLLHLNLYTQPSALRPMLGKSPCALGDAALPQPIERCRVAATSGG